MYNLGAILVYMSNDITVRITRVDHLRGYNCIKTCYFIANPTFDATAPRYIGEAVNPLAVREIGGHNKAGTVEMVKSVFRGQGRVTIVWPDGKTQSVRPFSAA